MQAIQVIKTARQFLDEIVKPDFDESHAELDSLRKAFHCAVSLYHLHDWVYVEHGSATGYASKEKFDKALCADPNFQLIRDIANAAKHLELTRKPQRITHIEAASVQDSAFGEGAWGGGPYGGTPRVRVQVGKDQYEEFSAVAQRVYDMWQKMFKTNGW